VKVPVRVNADEVTVGAVFAQSPYDQGAPAFVGPIGARLEMVQFDVKTVVPPASRNPRKKSATPEGAGEAALSVIDWPAVIA
jgi:hypothetical protein